MDEKKKLRNKILIILYESNEKHPWSYVHRDNLKEQMGISKNELDENVIYLEKKGYVEITTEGSFWFFEVRITANGIDYVENTLLNSNSFQNTETTTSNSKENSSTNSIKAFISYSTLDKDSGLRIKQILEKFDIESFLAHDDIETEVWKKRILNELREADIFIAVLSENFIKSKWCSQEVGIATFRDEYIDDILIIALSIDGTKSYGFIDKYQSRKIEEDNTLIKFLIKPIIKEFDHIDFIPVLIEELKNSQSWRYSEGIMSAIEPHFSNLSDPQIKKIVDYSIENFEVHSAELCAKKYLPKFLKTNENKIKKEKYNELNDLIREQGFN